ncbi:hypothetical protein SLS57_007050 [Botryosphaeria dothidea]
MSTWTQPIVMTKDILHRDNSETTQYRLKSKAFAVLGTRMELVVPEYKREL